MATAPIKLTAVFEPVEDGWVQASLVEWPAIITCGKTREEAHEMLLDAFPEMVLSYMDEDAAPPVGLGATESIQLTITWSEPRSRHTSCRTPHVAAFAGSSGFPVAVRAVELSRRGDAR